MSSVSSDILWSGPHAASSERALLAASLADPVALAEAASLAATDFSQPLDVVFTALKDLHDDKATPSRELLRDRILGGAEEKPEHGPVLAVVDGLEPQPAPVETVRGWVDEIKAYTRRRDFASALRRHSGSLLDGTKSLDEIVGGVLSSAMDVAPRAASGPVFVSDFIKNYEGGLEAVIDPRKGPQPRSTGFPGLDRILGGGFRPGELITLGARPSMGKTSWALNTAKHVMDGGKCVLMFSLEMSFLSLIQRLLCLYGNIPYSDFQRGPQGDADYKRLRGALHELTLRQFYADDSKSVDPGDLVLNIKRFASRRPVDLVIVDYLQLLSSRGKVENRTQEVSKISRSLKILAMELEVPVLALSQLSRGIENRRGNDRKPRLADLRESGSIEQDSDIVMFLHREEIYNQDAAPGDTEIIVAKQRNGPVGVVPLFFRGELMRFECRSDRDEEDEW